MIFIGWRNDIKASSKMLSLVPSMFTSYVFYLCALSVYVVQKIFNHIPACWQSRQALYY